MPETQTPRRDYRATLNLPRTDFPMRAELPKREPDRVRWWAEHDTYRKRLAKNAGNPPFILHDGPPYANGDLHMGHFLNRVLKDAFVKINLLDGKYADFVPGWDMHGLPIEMETLRHLKLDFHHVDPLELREKCRERALHWLDRQREAILRMGCGFGHYDDPYMTIAPRFEGAIVDVLAELAEAKQLYKGLRATLWCVHDETALAEAEIEYKDHVSPSIYVRFPADAAQRADITKRFGIADDGTPLSIVIWTTTPWTLPANVAVAIKPDAEYAIYRVGGEDVLAAEALAPALIERISGARDGGVLRGMVLGDALAGASVRHPFLDRDSVVVRADYVELETGTGAVHTAPGHGSDDFETGLKYGLPVLSPVDGAGRFTVDAGPYAGQNIFEAQTRIVDDLRAAGLLVSAESYEHSYPHCWRCKNPVIYRATAQWFISMDANGLRRRIVGELPEVTWTPAWGEERMTQMIEHHPEWCLSRQRTWGTPIPAVVCAQCNESTLDPRVARTVADRFRAEGARVWWTDPVEAFLPAGFACPKCGGTAFSKEMNIVDIWFESGVTHRAVLEDRGMPWPADVYLEGSDQYRGWFRSSLVTAVATKGHPPYKQVVGVGWVVDQDGRAMHKSAGNYIGAVEGIEKYGADVLRLWVASVEFTSDVRLGAKLLENVANVYRNLRNRFRWYLGSVDDLTPDAVVPRSAMEPLDRLVLAKLDAVARDIVIAYREFRLHDAYLALQRFDGEDLSAFYVDVLKDRLYTSAPDSARRRSAQSAVLEIFRTVAVLTAPILSFTAEEAWQALPAALRGGAESIFDLAFPKLGADDVPALELWDTLRGLRAKVAASEGERDFQLDADVSVPAAQLDAFRALEDGLREALVVSSLRGLTASSDGSAGVKTMPAAGEKCERCWKYLPLGSDAENPTLCAPCAEIVHVLSA
ncbi:MAG TPA: isoleucine--tRNA ligase [Candidatus Lustribacter sp.]|nr:isoleucine--tRNA ligase [Candidatus Lustribacter sp.]